MRANNIGKKLRILRGDKSQFEIAKALGISTSALSMYECGNRVPRDEIKVKMSKLYGKSIEEIFFTN